MHYKNTIEAVYIHLDEVQQLVARFGADGNIRAIDVDLTLDKIRDVYDLLLSLKNEQNAETVRIDRTEAPIIKSPGVGVGETSSEPQNTFELLEEEDVVEEVQQKQEMRHETTQAEKKSRVNKPDCKINIGESFVKEKPTINEELSQTNPSNDISSRLKTNSISNLGAAIGLNEKFEFIQNLFDGDSVRYNHTIEVLNTATDFNQAFDYINTNFKWDMNDPLVVKILDLIRRKLIVKKNGR